MAALLSLTSDHVRVRISDGRLELLAGQPSAGLAALRAVEPAVDHQMVREVIGGPRISSSE